MALTQINPALFAGATNTTAVIQSNGTTAITVDASQNVGIGTASPAQELHLYRSSGATDMLIEQASSGNAYVHTKNTSREYAVGTKTDVLAFIDLTADAERMRIDSSGNLLVGTTTSPSNSGNISALGAIKGGAVYQSSGYENGNYTLTTPATVYSFNKDQGGAGGSSTTTFNITGVSNVDGAWLFIYLRCSNTAGGINCGANIQVHGTQLFSASVQNTTKTITFGAFRQNGSWVATAAATGSQISAFP